MKFTNQQLLSLFTLSILSYKQVNAQNITPVPSEEATINSAIAVNSAAMENIDAVDVSNTVASYDTENIPDVSAVAPTVSAQPSSEAEQPPSDTSNAIAEPTANENDSTPAEGQVPPSEGEEVPEGFDPQGSEISELSESVTFPEETELPTEGTSITVEQISTSNSVSEADATSIAVEPIAASVPPSEQTTEIPNVDPVPIVSSVSPVPANNGTPQETSPFYPTNGTVSSLVPIGSTLLPTLEQVPVGSNVTVSMLPQVNSAFKVDITTSSVFLISILFSSLFL